MIPMLDKQNNLADVLPVQMEPRKEWSVNICLCCLHEYWDLIGSLNTGRPGQIFAMFMNSYEYWIGFWTKIQIKQMDKTKNSCCKLTDVNVKEERNRHSTTSIHVNPTRESKTSQGHTGR